MIPSNGVHWFPNFWDNFVIPSSKWYTLFGWFPLLMRVSFKDQINVFTVLCYKSDLHQIVRISYYCNISPGPRVSRCTWSSVLQPVGSTLPSWVRLCEHGSRLIGILSPGSRILFPFFVCKIRTLTASLRGAMTQCTLHCFIIYQIAKLLKCISKQSNLNAIE